LALKRGANPKLSNKYGDTPLHLAARPPESEFEPMRMSQWLAICMLREAGADPNAKNGDGLTPRDVALFSENNDALALLSVPQSMLPKGIIDAVLAAAEADPYFKNINSMKEVQQLKNIFETYKKLELQRIAHRKEALDKEQERSKKQWGTFLEIAKAVAERHRKQYKEDERKEQEDFKLKQQDKARNQEEVVRSHEERVKKIEQEWQKTQQADQNNIQDYLNLIESGAIFNPR
jgi:hypothetical protein